MSAIRMTSISVASGRLARPSRKSAVVQCSKPGPAPGPADGQNNNNKRGLKPGSGAGKRAKQPGLYEVQVVTPPPRSLGIYALPPNTQCGEEIDVEGQGYVVTTVVLQYKLRGGKYVRHHNRLDVQPTGRWLVNQMLENLIKARYVGPTGSQD
ncbi:hypothetical protein CHLRE_12g498700v5 [Chlamydomonas reinhardtii]|uniref:Uncharacterized protein n=1 Tax=Chlamydomonas reinhardtii TaxID=3055 RepID=A8JGJ3_CHLRE|nr:uncharacterized protein CHLRE_12g498700v5 [Chlamydomonas reinhardtii]PNW75053.1 hypothetical protein CHLRE_12g498700v5 [Chlamydomonas reinhardtii]|eukprot:XP_001702345.1 predicted protein [Chlamydomonas reinhardtii]